MLKSRTMFLFSAIGSFLQFERSSKFVVKKRWSPEDFTVLLKCKIKNSKDFIIST